MERRASPISVGFYCRVSSVGRNGHWPDDLVFVTEFTLGPRKAALRVPPAPLT